MSSSSQTEPSWSRMATGEKAEGTFRFAADRESVKYFRMKGPGELETKWQLKIYPVNEKSVSVSLFNESKFKVMAEYKIHVIDQCGKEREVFKSEAEEYDSGTQQGIFGWVKSKWLKRDEPNARPDEPPDGNIYIIFVCVFQNPR